VAEAKTIAIGSKLLMVGKVECVVRATPGDVLAFLMHYDSRIARARLNPQVEVRWDVLEKPSDHRVVFFNEKRLGALLAHRTFLNSNICKKLSEDPLVYVWVSVPLGGAHPSVDVMSVQHAVQADFVRCCRMSAVGDATKLESVFHLDLNGRLPKWLTHKVIIPKLLREPYTLQVYFSKIQSAVTCKSEDGTYIGHMLIDALLSVHKERRAVAAAKFVAETDMLRESGVASLDALISATLGASGHDVRPQAVATTTPGALTVAEATAIGRGFDAIIRVSATPSDAVDELLQTYPAVNAATQQHLWLRPMLETIAKRRAETAPLGLKLRLSLGAAFSMSDMASDAAQIVALFLAGRSLRAFALLAMIAMNLAVQALVAILQTAHLGWRAVLWELSIVFSLLKPAIDAIRVAGGAEQAEGAPIDPLVEMMICKCSEMTDVRVDPRRARASDLPPRWRRLDHGGGRFGLPLVHLHRVHSYHHGF
jgi:hypothetical protein